MYIPQVLIDPMHRFAISRTATPPAVSPPTRFPSSSHDPTAFPDPVPPPHRNLSRTSTMSLNAGYHSTVSYAPPIETPPLSPPGSIEPGIYEIKNHVWGSAVDLNAADKRSVIAFSYHGQGNQQWEFTPLGKGWSIRSASSGMYLTVEKGIGSGVPLVASDYPVAWIVQPDNGSGAGLFRISWPNTEATWEMQDGRGGTPIQLANRYPQEPQDRKLWRLVLVSSNTHVTHHSPQSFMPEPDMPHPQTRERRSGSVHHNSHRERHRRGQSRPPDSGAWSSDTDSDASYTITKTITKTKTKSRASKKVKGKR